MPYAEFLLRVRASALRHLLTVEAVGLGMGGGSTLRINRLAELEDVSSGR